MKPHLSAWLSLLLTLTCTAVLADEARERQLELDVAQLRRELLAQSRRIDELERQTQRGVREPAATVPLASPALPAWLVAANWERVRPGMSEAEVTQVLGTPTSNREANAQRKTLFYALEIAPEAYLAGSVEMLDGRVSEVKKPVLR
jgi:hypothetical protein